MVITVYGSSSKGNCYRLQTAGDTTILLDAGIPLKDLQRRGCRISTLDGAVITHSHGDHSKAIKDLIYRGVNCYMLQETCNELGEKICANIISPNKTFKIKDVKITPFMLQHDVPNLGYLINDGVERLVYITDTYYCKYRFNGLTKIMIECNYSLKILEDKVNNKEINRTHAKRLLKSHFALENVLEFLAANDISNVTEIWLIHLSDNNSDATLFKNTIERATGVPCFIAG